MHRHSKRVMLFVLTTIFVFTISGAAMAAEAMGLKLSGFVDASYSDADFSDSGFSLDQVELDIEKALSDRLSLRADINYLPGGNLTFDDIVEQGYVTYTVPVDKGMELTFGKFNAPIGFELLDPVDMYQYSHSLVFDFGLPTNLTGLMGSYDFTDKVNLVLYIVNGWDVNTDNNNTRTIGGRIGVTPIDGVSIGFSAITGAEKDKNPKDKRTVFDVDLTVTMIEKLLVGAELNIGREENASNVTTGSDADWTGFLIMAHYDLKSYAGFTVRYDYFHDNDGARLGSNVDEKRQAVTLAPTFSLAEGTAVIVELRHDWSDKKVFGPAGREDDTKDTIAFEFTYAF